MFSITVNLNEFDYPKYQEMVEWCESSTRGKWNAVRYNPWQYEAILSNTPNFGSSFDFELQADAAMFKLTWFEG